MPLTKQTLPVNFSQDLDTKTDPFQLPPGKFLALENSTFNDTGKLVKRNGFQDLPAPPAGTTTLTTFQGNLIAAGDELDALLQSGSQWIDQGRLAPIGLSAMPLVRSSLSQTTLDTAVSVDKTLLCTVWVDSLPYYQVQDSITGQVVAGPTTLPTGAKNPRVFLLGNNFIVTYTISESATPKLKYIAVPLANPGSPLTALDLSTEVKADDSAYDGVVANNTLFMAWNGSDVGGAIRITYMDIHRNQGGTEAIATFDASYISVCADESGTTPVIWITWLVSTTLTAYAVTPQLVQVLTPTTFATSVSSLVELTSIATSRGLTVLWQVTQNYSYSAIKSDIVKVKTITQAGVLGVVATIYRSVGLASKPFYIGSTAYVALAYGSTNSGLLQPTYFLGDISGNIVAKFAAGNGGGYYPTFVLPSVTVDGADVYFGYLFKDLLAAVNPASLTPPSTTANVYTQTGINLIHLSFESQALSNVEIGHNLHLGAGFIWMYDGVKPVEHGYFLFPEDVVITTSGSGGSITAQTYYYVWCYEWTDSQGNIHRSAPSEPKAIVTTGSTSTNTVNVPYLRLTYKVGANKVRLVGYRWSTANPVYYRLTSITSPQLNVITSDSLTYTDTVADSSIVGNDLLYTTGGVVENIQAPASSAMTLFKSRVMLVNAEDENSVWFSKVVVEGVPAEFSDLFTIFVEPTIGAEGSTGKVKALAPMDDKLIYFKPSAIYYSTGDGPDNTGANNDFSRPTFITGTVGSTNPNSIVLIPQGLMFQSGKGIWLLGRDLSTSYIGAAVQAYNDLTVTSANTIPGTNQVRFTLGDGEVTLMYDYFENKWGTFTAANAISSTLYGGLHTYLNSDNQVRQENPGSYLDGSTPVLMKFTTGWFNLAGLQGFERIYYFTLLGTYLTPHFLDLMVAYDYKEPSQAIRLSPDNFSPAYGGDEFYGSGQAFGGPGSLEQFRVFTDKQKCEAFQITLQETYDSSKGVAAGAGFTLSGINLVVGAKKTYTPVSAAKSAG